MITNNKDLEVYGKTHVMFIDANGHNGAMIVNILKAGDRYDLKKRKPVSGLKASGK